MGGFNRDIATFHRFKIPVKSCRISKSDLLCCNGCKMLKQVQHDKFYGELASPTRGEAILLLKSGTCEMPQIPLIKYIFPALRHTCYSAKHTA